MTHAIYTQTSFVFFQIWHTWGKLSSIKQKVQNFPPATPSQATKKIHSPPTELLNSNFCPTNTLYSRAKSFPDIPELAVSALEKSPSSKSWIMESRADAVVQEQTRTRAKVRCKKYRGGKPENNQSKQKPKKPKPTNGPNRETRAPQLPVLRAGAEAGCTTAGQGAGLSNLSRPG